MAVYKADYKLGNRIREAGLVDQADFSLKARDYSPVEWESQELQIGDIIVDGGLVSIVSLPEERVFTPTPKNYHPQCNGGEWKLGHRD